MIDQTAQRTMQVPGEGIVPRGRPTIDYVEYPKMMTHPAHQPGKPSPEIKSPHGFTYHGIGEPIRFPPVLVKTRQDEEYHASLGYVSQGKCDAAAFDRAVGAGQIPSQVAYKPLEYPKWVLGKLVHSKAEEDKLTGKQTEELVLDVQGFLGEQTDHQLGTNKARPDLDMGGPTFIPDAAPTKTLDQLRIEDLENKVNHLTLLLAQALKAQNKPAQSELVVPPKKALKAAKAGKKAARKQPVLTTQQKNARSEAIRAGLARRKALLTESTAAEQSDDAPVG